MAPKSDTRYSSDDLSSEPNLDSSASAAKDPNSPKPQGVDEAALDGTDLDAASPDPLTVPLAELEEDYEQILQELRLTKTEQAVTERRNRKLTLDKVSFGISGAFAIGFVICGFF